VFDDLERSDLYFKNAYALAEKQANYDTKYIDNQYARLLLANAVQNPSESNHMVAFRQAKNLLLNQMRDERRHYPFRVAAAFADFFNTFESVLLPGEVSEVVRACEEVLARIDSLPSDRQSHKYVIRCRENMSYVVEMTNTYKTQPDTLTKRTTP
jgi:hypothetical protein